MKERSRLMKSRIGQIHRLFYTSLFNISIVFIMNSENLLKINVNGVVSRKRDIAKKELYEHFKALGNTPEIGIEIVVTPDFDQTVDSILRERKESKCQYTSKREHVVAVAKTIPYPREDNIGFIIVFNGDVFGKWKDQQRIWRLMMFLHESVHVEDELQLFQEIGAKVFFSDPTTVEDTMFRLAHGIWMDYHAERFSIETLEKAAKEVDPQGTVTYGSHEGYIKSFVESLNNLPMFLDKEIDDFRKWRMTMDEFWPKVYLRLRETLILASFVTAHSDALNKTNVEIEEMKNNESHLFFFKRWNKMHVQLQSLYQLKNNFCKEILTNIGDELVLLSKECGMTLSNIENGIYVAVNPPNFRKE